MLTTSKIFVVVDKISSFPLFYYYNGVETIITDDIRNTNSDNDNTGIIEFLSSGFCIGKKTIYHDVCRVQAGEYAVLGTGSTPKTFNYYIHKKNGEFANKLDIELLSILDEVIKNTFRRLVSYANGRSIVVLLSGGYDSRLIVTTLRRLKYHNVICTSFGTNRDKDFVVAEQVAKLLGYRFIPVHVNKQFWRERLKNGEINKILDITSSTGTISHFHLGSIVKILLDEQVIPKDSIFITGQSGDAVEGNDTTGFFCGRENIQVCEVIDAIVDKHFYFLGNKSLRSKTIKAEVSKWLKDVGFSDKKLYNEREAEDIIECFNWRERQSKFVVSDVRNYDKFLNCDWFLPLWDDEFIAFWEKIDFKRYNKRMLYYKYLKDYLREEFPTANVVTKRKSILNSIKSKLACLHGILYFIKSFRDYCLNDDIYFAPLGGVKISVFIKSVLMGRGFRHNPISHYVFYWYMYVLHKDY